jgi:hypothetical protein
MRYNWRVTQLDHRPNNHPHLYSIPYYYTKPSTSVYRPQRGVHIITPVTSFLAMLLRPWLYRGSRFAASSAGTR